MLWRDAALCDLLLVERTPRGAHACVLAAASPVLRAAAGRGGAAALQAALLGAVPPAAWPAVLRFVYRGVLRVADAAEARAVTRAADRLQIGRLRALCADYLRARAPDVALAASASPPTVTVKDEPDDWYESSCYQHQVAPPDGGGGGGALDDQDMSPGEYTHTDDVFLAEFAATSRDYDGNAERHGTRKRMTYRVSRCNHSIIIHLNILLTYDVEVLLRLGDGVVTVDLD